MYRVDGEIPADSEGVAELIIGKQRNGPTGVVRVAFLKQYTRFENLAGGASYGSGTSDL
jgi:replicative DNA helicase